MSAAQKPSRPADSGTAGAPPPGSRLAARGLSLAYDDRLVVEGLDLDIPDGRVTVVVGPNACGKSTLLRALGRLLRPRGGSVLLDGAELAGVPTRQIARTLGLLPQSPVPPEGITVADLVSRGRQPHQRWWQQWSEADERLVAEAMERTATTDLADRLVDELSGGQRQRAWIAMALAQDTDLLLLDEPTTFLDIAHQVEVLDLVRRLNRERGRTVVAVLHDLNQAARYADHLVAMKAGRVVAEGPPAEVVTAELVGEVFGLACVVVPDPVTGDPLVVPGAPWGRPDGPGADGDGTQDRPPAPAPPTAPAPAPAPAPPADPASAPAPTPPTAPASAPAPALAPPTAPAPRTAPASAPAPAPAPPTAQAPAPPPAPTPTPAPAPPTAPAPAPRTPHS